MCWMFLLLTHKHMVCRCFDSEAEDGEPVTDAYQRTAVDLVMFLEAGTKRACVLPNLTVILGDRANSASVVLTLCSRTETNAARILNSRQVLQGYLGFGEKSISVYALELHTCANSVDDVNTLFNKREQGQCVFTRNAINMEDAVWHMDVAFLLLRHYDARTIARKPSVKDDATAFTPFD